MPWFYDDTHARAESKNPGTVLGLDMALVNLRTLPGTATDNAAMPAAMVQTRLRIACADQ